MLTTNTDGTYTVRHKDGTQQTFATVPGTQFPSSFDDGPVYRLTKIEDRNGNATLLTYSGGNLIQVMDTYGRVLGLAYDGDHKLHQIIDPANRATTLHYNASELRQIEDPDLRFLTYTYNANHQLATKVDRDGRVFRYEYQDGKPVAIEDGGGTPVLRLDNPHNWAIDQVALTSHLSREYIPTTTTKTDGRGHLWRHSYDEQGYITATEAPDGSLTGYEFDETHFLLTSKTVVDTTDAVVRFAYDANGNRLSLVEPNGNATNYQYDRLNRPIAETNAACEVTRTA